MLKHQPLKLLLVLALIAALIGGVSAASGAATAQVAPAHHLLACGALELPPCW